MSPVHVRSGFVTLTRTFAVHVLVQPFASNVTVTVLLPPWFQIASAVPPPDTSPAPDHEYVIGPSASAAFVTVTCVVAVVLAQVRRSPWHTSCGCVHFTVAVVSAMADVAVPQVSRPST